MHPTTRLLQPILKRSSYYNEDYRQSAALIRARRPYIFKNLLTGAAIMGFALSVFAFTIKAVGQETFDDVIVPDAPQDRREGNVGQGVMSTQQAKTPNVGSNGMR